MTLSTRLLWRADQDRAQTDRVVARLVDDVRADLARGVDSTELWWRAASGITGEPREYLAACLVAALLKLAEREEIS